MPTTMLVRKAGIFLQRPDHDVERVGDADDEGLGRIFGDAGAHLRHDLEIDFEQIVAAHAGLARHAGGDDADIGAVDRLIFVGAGELGIEAFDRARLGDIEGFALRKALGDVEDDDVAQFLEAARWASVPPIMPPPISAIFLRAMSGFPSR